MTNADVTENRFRLLLLILLGTWATVLPTVTFGAANNAEIPRTIEELNHRIARVLEKHSVPGAGLALVSKETITWVGGIGAANFEASDKMTKDTHFRLGSCTKSFVGLGFLRLLEEGRIDLTAPVRDLVPEIVIDNPWSDTDPVRVIHLLEHTSGFDDSRFRSVWAYTGPESSLRRALASTASSRRVRWRPGSRYAYSNPGYALGGYVLEKITGEPYEDYLRETILIPLGMTTSTFRITDESRRLLATGYDAGGAPTPYSHIYHPAGSLNSSAQEMGLFVRFLLDHGNSGQTALLGESIERLGTHMTTLAAQAGLEMGYGFGVSQYFRDGFRCFGHSGGSPGFISKYCYIPDAGVGCVLLLNKLDEEALDEAFKLVFDFLTRDATAPVKGAEFQPPVAQLGTFAGYYELRSPRIELLRFLDILLGGVSVTLEDGELHQEQFMSARTAMVPVSSDTFRAPDEPAASKIFLAAPEDRVVFVDRKTYYERTGAWKPYVYRVLVFGAVTLMLTVFLYPLLWVPVHLWRRLYRRQQGVEYLRMRVTPLLAVLSLVVGIVAVGNQTVLELGQLTLENVVFFVSTLAFAAMSMLSLFFALASFRRRVNLAARVYALAVSVACCLMTGYLGYWGLIGLRTWTY